MKKSVLIVDAWNYAFRAGIIESLTNPKGESVQVIFGMLRMLQGSLKQLRSTVCIVVWDGKKSRWRKTLHPEYKHRPKSPDQQLVRQDLQDQVNRLRRETFPLLPIIDLRMKNFEADDVIAGLVYLFSDFNDWEVTVASTDKDFFQLLDKTNILQFDGGIMTAEVFEEEYGFSSMFWPIYRSIVGDNSDNIPGIKGLGDKSARAFLHNGKHKDKVEEHEELMIRNLKLITLGPEYPSHRKITRWLSTQLNNYQPTLQEPEFQRYCLEQKFKSILRRYNAWIQPFKRLGGIE